MSATPKFAILRTQKIKDFSAMARRADHCERTGKTLPANADKTRQHLNTRIFPKDYGPEQAILRWRKRLGKKRVRRNAVLGIEIFMGMSPGADTGMTPATLKAWYQDSINWAAETFGGKANIIAGATNGDETTPHVHLIVIPIDLRGNLNCRYFLGGSAKLRTLQSSYAKAVEQHGLERGVEGSKRKYIPQKVLNEWRNQVDRDYKKAINRIDQARDQLEEMSAIKWAASKKKVIADLNEVFDQTKNEMTYAFGMAQDVILARRDLTEYKRFVREKTEAQEVAIAKSNETKDVLKANANLVRGLDLVPIATEILTLTPTEKNGVFTFSDANVSLQINGRKFHDAKLPDCKGSGAIDLVHKLTGRNVKESIEFLMTRHTTDEITADAAGNIAEQKREEIKAQKMQPRILTLDDIPKRIWQPVPSAWPLLCKRLIENHNQNPKTLQSLNAQNLIWATSDTTLAVARTDLNGKDATHRGVTLLDISSPLLSPRILLPDQAGVFWVGNDLAKADTIVAVANPLEALSYREISLLDFKQQQPTEKNATPLIISLDATLPNDAIIEQIKKTKKKFRLATNTPLKNEQLAAKIPLLLDSNGQFFDWFEIEPARADLAVKDRPLGWTKLLAEKIRESQINSKVRGK